MLQIPIVAHVLLLVLACIIATLFSVTPRIILWKSYQRLQGMYTTFSYLKLFAALACNLQKQEQVARVIATAILTSLLNILYGVFQCYGENGKSTSFENSRKHIHRQSQKHNKSILHKQPVDHLTGAMISPTQQTNHIPYARRNPLWRFAQTGFEFISNILVYTQTNYFNLSYLKIYRKHKTPQAI